MADNDNDPTIATPGADHDPTAVTPLANDDATRATSTGHTQPMRSPSDRVTEPQAPEPVRPSGWRAGQVVVVATLALLLGGAGASLVWLAGDRGADEAIDPVAAPTTSTTSDDPDPSTSATSTTLSDSTTTTSRRSADTGRSGGQTAVGTGVFTGSFQGNSDRSTDDFTVGDNWKIRWDVPGGGVTIEVFDAAGEVVETIQARDQGELVVDEGGTYRLDISTDGSRYTIAVTDGP